MKKIGRTGCSKDVYHWQIEISFVLCDWLGQRMFCAKLMGILANLTTDLINKFIYNNNLYLLL